ncbi:MAG: HIT family protein [Nitratireductor sp.]|nr:HIT family protein [Nitratireductor sp.]
MTTPSKTRTLDSRLEKDTIPIASSDAWQTRLMNDSRWPWIIVVPVLPGISDIDDYPPGGLGPLVNYLSEISAALKEMGVCTSTNVATLGNVVTQMHWHVVGRREDDANWPGPVWGFETALPYGKEEAETFIDSFRKALHVPF